MDIDTDIQSFLSWPFFQEPSSIDQISLNLPYFENKPFMDFSPSVFNDPYDLPPLPDSLEDIAIPLSCLPPLPEKFLCSEEIMIYCATDAMPIISAGKEDQNEAEKSIRRAKPARKRLMRSCDLELEELKAYFHMPITKAAIEMNIGLTVLKKRCRDLGITRWPHRKLKSLNTLINNIQEIGDEASIKKELMLLEEHKKLMEENPEIQLTEETKKLRQACFKANYKKRVAMHRPYLQSIQSISYN